MLIPRTTLLSPMAVFYSHPVVERLARRFSSDLYRQDIIMFTIYISNSFLPGEWQLTCGSGWHRNMLDVGVVGMLAS